MNGRSPHCTNNGFFRAKSSMASTLDGGPGKVSPGGLIASNKAFIVSKIVTIPSESSG